MLKIIASIFFLIGCASATEEISYTTLKKDGDFEVRQYDSYITATVSFETEEELDRQGFRILADYIFGNNISMTSPVITGGEDIGMTAPVFMNEGEYSMTFVMPARYTMETLPRPQDERIIIQEVPSIKKAAVRFNGRMTEKRKVRFERELRDWIAKENMTIASRAIFAGYNPPWTLPVFRRNEVLFFVK